MARALSHFNGKTILLSLSKSNPFPPSSSSSSHRRMIVTTAQTQSYWSSIESEIEAHLKKAIPVRPPIPVFEPMHHLVFAAPATKAPALCIAACELVGGHRAQALDAASALHLMHSAAHAHENLPLTDQPKPKPAIHHAYGPNIELLTGDGIVPFGFELLARSLGPAQNNSDKVLRVLIEMTRAVGSLGVIDGQYQEMLGTQSDGRKLSDVAWIEHVCKKKEGESHACGAACGVILGGGSEDEIERLRSFGVYVGMIHGMMNWEGGSEGLMEELERLRGLALKELENFSGRQAEAISCLVEGSLCNV
ncbi:Heterodimeric geranylgeranyl pyrophosphate synthase small subunit like [Actinidia chinensis var. chinensis]|uniref:Heterodimeric geranylgeranyl pyrophosphate synthase small subunit like n=1 Tax=Actinidia chinensis var. chinensis TaxID=1590841 RepID=A0A2R6PRE1_ACTCC|nr:Heterodimeric geranylgeranyl pyrophosphate synthase small subunit like [Actinidia chinensis var. chinensis]